MAPPVTCICGTCERCKRRVYMCDYYRRNAETVRATARRSRERRIDAARAYDRERGFRDYSPEKTAARRKVRDALRDGRLVRQPCETCGTVERVEAHHEDYSRPLDVRWLCRTHHAIEHRTVAA